MKTLGLEPVLTPVSTHWSPARLHAKDQHTLGPAIQPVLNPPHCLFIQFIVHQLLRDNLVGEGVRIPTEVHVDDTDSLSHIYHGSHYIVETFQVRKV